MPANKQLLPLLRMVLFYARSAHERAQELEDEVVEMDMRAFIARISSAIKYREDGLNG